MFHRRGRSELGLEDWDLVSKKRDTPSVKRKGKSKSIMTAVNKMCVEEI